MKIVFLTRRFWPDIGGVEKHVYEISKRLVEKGNSVTVVTQSQGKTQISGIKIARIKKTPNISSEKFHMWEWLWENRDLFKDADVVHAHDVYFWYFPFRFIFPFKKSFVTFHGYETYPIYKRAIFMRKLSEKFCNGNIIVGEFIKKWYGTKPNHVTYGGVEISNIKYQISNKSKKGSAVFIGRLDEQTGILDYAKAVDLIRKDYPKFKFAIVGDGKYRDRLKRYGPLGFKENAENFLKQYNFAFVSRYLSILEALASKRLVFALYDNPIKEDYLKMTPFSKFIVVSGSPQDLARKVKYFIDNPEKQKALEDKGFEFAKKQTWDSLINQYLNLWKENKK